MVCLDLSTDTLSLHQMPSLCGKHSLVTLPITHSVSSISSLLLVKSNGSSDLAWLCLFLTVMMAKALSIRLVVSSVISNFATKTHASSQVQTSLIDNIKIVTCR